MIAAIGTVSLSKGAAISQARAAYDNLTADEKALVTNYDKLLAAEAAYAKLVAEMGKKLDEIYKTTGNFMATLGTPTVNSTGGEWMVIGLARSDRNVPGVEDYYKNEATKAVTEKVSAMLESSFAATQATTAFWWGLALNPLGQFDLATAAVKAADSTLEPFARRTRANAARLSGYRR